MTSSDIFTCKKCGDCCRGYGGTFVSERDIEAIARFVYADPEHFVAEYCRISGGRPVLAQKEDGYCVFWDGLCRIHPVKPRMCRQWPFIESVRIDVSNWRIMGGCCPGIRTDVADEVIQECVRKYLR